MNQIIPLSEFLSTISSFEFIEADDIGEIQRFFVNINGFPFKRLYDKLGNKTFWCDEHQILGGATILNDSMGNQFEDFYQLHRPETIEIKIDKYI